MSKKARVRKVFEFSIITRRGKESYERVYETMIIARNKRRAIKRFKREVAQIKVKDMVIDDVYWKKGNKIYWDRECIEGVCEDSIWK